MPILLLLALAVPATAELTSSADVQQSTAVEQGAAVEETAHPPISRPTVENALTTQADVETQSDVETRADVQGDVQARADVQGDVQADTGVRGQAGADTGTGADRAASPDAGLPTAAATGTGVAAGMLGTLVAWGAARAGLLARLAGGLGLFAGFSRIDEHDVLEHPVRHAVHDLVQARPGVTILEVTETLGIAWGTAVYHLRRLEQAKRLVSQREGRERRHWDIQAPEARLRGTTKVLRSGTPRRIAQVIEGMPDITQKQVRERLGLAPSVASRHLARLEQAGLVESRRDGTTVRYQAADALTKAWALAGPAPQPRVRPTAVPLA